MKRFPRRMPAAGILGMPATTMFKMALKNYPEKNYNGILDWSPKERPKKMSG